MDFNRVGLFRVENFGLQSSTRLINNFQPGWNLFLDFKLRLNLKKFSIQVENLSCNLQPGWEKIFSPIEICFLNSTQGWIPKNFQSRLKIWIAIFNPGCNRVVVKFFNSTNSYDCNIFVFIFLIFTGNWA